MSATKIEWAERSWNPIVGCSVVSPGCTNCYAMKQADRIKKMTEGRTGNPADSHYFGTTKIVNEKPVWTGKVAMAPDQILLEPLRRKKPATYFVNSMGDLFHDAVPDEWIDRVYAIMLLCPQHTFIVLTKRSERMQEYFRSISDNEGGRIEGMRSAMVEGMAQSIYAEQTGEDPSMWLAVQLPLPNVWLGVSAEDQTRADERIPDLLATPAAVRLVSCEPLLGPIDLEVAWAGENALNAECWGDCGWCSKGMPALHNCHLGKQANADFSKGRSGLDWVIAGGESGKNARPMHPDWARSLRDQCVAADVPFFFKQWGEWAPAKLDKNYAQMKQRGVRDTHFWPGGEAVDLVGKKAAGHMLDGQEWQQMPSIGVSP